MQRISVNYSVSKTVALNEGRSEYGTATYQPTDTELQFLCVTDRQYLDNHERETFHLPTSAPPAWPVIADAIRLARLAAEELEQQRAGEQAAKIEAALGKPDDDWIQSGCYNEPSICVPGFGGWMYTPAAVRDDPRVAARLEALRPEVERRCAERKQQREDDQAKREAAQASAGLAKAAALESLRQWALASDDAALSRAARDGYDVANAIVGLVATDLASEVCGQVSTEGTEYWSRWNFEKRAAPSAEAFEAYDHIRQAIAELAKPDGINVELHKIARVKVDAPDDDPDGERECYTAIVVMVTAPDKGCKDRAVIVRVDK
jgi:hypothetical protein